MKHKYGVVHGRFQPFHNDHLRFVLAALGITDILYIGITNPDPSSTKYDATDPKRSAETANPFTFYERLEMITQSLLETGVMPSRFRVVPFPINVPELWKHYAPPEATYFITIYDQWGEKKLRMLTSRGLNTEVLWKKDITDKGISATQIRSRITNGESWGHLVPAGTFHIVSRLVEERPQRFPGSNRYSADAHPHRGKTFVIIVDGGADRPIPGFEGKTPFEQANTPNLDHMAQEGMQGLVTLIDETICPESDSGTMAILSYDPLQFYTGRGPLEGVGADFITIGDNNSISMRINFASYDPQGDRLDRRTARDLSDGELQALTQEIKDRVRLDQFGDVNFDILSFGRHRGVVSFTSEGHRLSGNISNTDPGFEKVGVFGVPRYQPFCHPLICRALDDGYESSLSAAIVNAFISQSHRVLSESTINRRRVAEGKLPANMLLARDAGDPPRPLQPFKQKFGRTISLYGQIPAERGLAKLIGGDFSYVRMPAHEQEEAFFTEAARSVVRDKSDVVCVHIVKSADEAGHSGDPHAKVEAIERFDRYFLGELLSGIGTNDTCIVTCDHATPCELGIHSSDRVPVLVYGPGVASDELQQFGESFAGRGGLPVLKATGLLHYVFSINGKRGNLT